MRDYCCRLYSEAAKHPFKKIAHPQFNHLRAIKSSKSGLFYNAVRQHSDISMSTEIRDFLGWSNAFDCLVTKQLAHIRGNWELTWDHESKIYEPEEESYAEIVNNIIDVLSKIQPPSKYHDNEDCLAEYCKEHTNWNIRKVENRWIGPGYVTILENGGFRDINQRNLILSASGRIKAAITRGQLHFDDMEESHQTMLANVFAIILYHRGNV